MLNSIVLCVWWERPLAVLAVESIVLEAVNGGDEPLPTVEVGVVDLAAAGRHLTTTLGSGVTLSWFNDGTMLSCNVTVTRLAW